jgi:hypothetical protein
MVAMSITAIAGTALLLGVASGLQTTSDALEQEIARGMAQQLMDEVLGARYMAVGDSPYSTNLGRSAYESQGSGRERYNDIDDYNGLQIQPPEDVWGIELGSDDGEGDLRHPAFRAPAGFFDQWRQKIDVYYVSPANPDVRLSVGQVSDYRAVEVQIERIDPERGSRQLTRLRRVVAYVPPLP